MITDILTALANTLLATYPQYNEGYANVFKPSQKDIVINDAGDYCGIADNNGNYFYIRSLKETRYTPKYTSARPIAYNAKTTCRIVSVLHSDNPQAHVDALISAVSNAGHFLTRAVYENTLVFKEETGNDLTNLNTVGMSFVLVDFDVEEIVSAKKCPPELCKC